MKQKSLNITSHSPEETYQLGVFIGSHVTPGTIIALEGELGSGKTTFVQGLAKGLDVPEDYYITSPTYTLINEYPGRCTLYHVDLYRLDGPDDVENIGLYDLFHNQGVVAIEWADRLDNGSISDYLRILTTISGETSRQISFSANGENTQLIIEKIRKMVVE